MKKTLNVLIVLRDARTISFRAEGFNAACREVARMSKDKFYNEGGNSFSKVFMAPADGSGELTEYGAQEAIDEADVAKR